MLPADSSKIPSIKYDSYSLGLTLIEVLYGSNLISHEGFNKVHNDWPFKPFAFKNANKLRYKVIESYFELDESKINKLLKKGLNKVIRVDADLDKASDRFNLLNAVLLKLIDPDITKRYTVSEAAVIIERIYEKVDGNIGYRSIDNDKKLIYASYNANKLYKLTHEDLNDNIMFLNEDNDHTKNFDRSKEEQTTINLPYENVIFSSDKPKPTPKVSSSNKNISIYDSNYRKNPKLNIPTSYQKFATPGRRSIKLKASDSDEIQYKSNKPVKAFNNYRVEKKGIFPSLDQKYQVKPTGRRNQSGSRFDIISNEYLSPNMKFPGIPNSKVNISKLNQILQQNDMNSGNRRNVNYSDIRGGRKLPPLKNFIDQFDVKYNENRPLLRI